VVYFIFACKVDLLIDEKAARWHGLELSSKSKVLHMMFALKLTSYAELGLGLRKRNGHRCHYS